MEPETTKTQWFVDVEGRKIGPLTLEKVRSLLQEGKLVGTALASRDSDAGPWVAVSEIVDPPDPTLSLFDTLMAAKEKTAPQHRPPPVKPQRAPRPANPSSQTRAMLIAQIKQRLSEVPPLIWIIAGLALLLSIITFSMIRVLQRPAILPESQPLRANTPFTPPPQSQQQQQPVRTPPLRSSPVSRPTTAAPLTRPFSAPLPSQETNAPAEPHRDPDPPETVQEFEQPVYTPPAVNPEPNPQGGEPLVTPIQTE